MLSSLVKILRHPNRDSIIQLKEVILCKRAGGRQVRIGPSNLVKSGNIT